MSIILPRYGDKPFSLREKVSPKGADEGAAKAILLNGLRQSSAVKAFDPGRLLSAFQLDCLRRTLTPTPLPKGKGLF